MVKKLGLGKSLFFGGVTLGLLYTAFCLAEPYLTAETHRKAGSYIRGAGKATVAAVSSAASQIDLIAKQEQEEAAKAEEERLAKANAKEDAFLNSQMLVAQSVQQLAAGMALQAEESSTPNGALEERMSNFEGCLLQMGNQMQEISRKIDSSLNSQGTAVSAQQVLQGCPPDGSRFKPSTGKTVGAGVGVFGTRTR